MLIWVVTGQRKGDRRGRYETEMEEIRIVAPPLACTACLVAPSPAHTARLASPLAACTARLAHMGCWEQERDISVESLRKRPCGFHHGVRCVCGWVGGWEGEKGRSRKGEGSGLLEMWVWLKCEHVWERRRLWKTWKLKQENEMWTCEVPKKKN